MKLTATKVKNAKPKDRDFKLFDGLGLYLLVRSNGAKYWRLKYRIAGKEKLLALGVYPEVSLADARSATSQYRTAVRSGVDPSHERKIDKVRSQINSRNSFQKVAEDWLDVQATNWSPIHLKKVRRSLEVDVYPFIGREPISEISTPLILDVIRKIEARDALDTSSRIFQRINSVFRFAVQTARCKSNPATELQGALRSRKVRHRRGLPLKELQTLRLKLEKYEGQPTTVFALKLLLLTFARPSEVREARWDEFDLEKHIWRIPAARMKMREEHIVPLSTQAVSLLESLRSLTGNHELLFPSAKDPNAPISDNSLIYALHRLGYKDRISPHGFRASASTFLNESGYPPDVIERQLAHRERNKVRAAYNHAEYMEQRTEMMQFWSDKLYGV